MTSTELLTAFYEILGDSIVTPQYVTEAQATEFMNDAIRYLNTRYQIQVKETTVIISPDGYADYPTEAREMRSVRFDGSSLHPTTTSQLSNLSRQWRQNIADTPLAYFLNELDRRIGLYPRPEYIEVDPLTVSIPEDLEVSGYVSESDWAPSAPSDLEVEPGDGDPGDPLRSTSAFSDAFDQDAVD